MIIIIKLGSLFDGIGGFPLAGMRHGITPVWASEIEKFPIEVTKQHFPDMKHLGDITKINGAEIEPVDVVTFGSPCQDLSVAGKRAGLDGERSGLFMEAVRIIREMRNATNGKYPRFAVWENVPGAFSSAKGNDFRAVLEEITESKIPIPNSGRWATAGVVRSNGIEAAWRVLDAQHWGVPQRRKRIFLVADFAGTSAAEILFVEKSLRGDSTEGRKEGQGITGRVKGSTQRTVWGFIGKNSAKTRSIGETKNISPILDTGGSNVQIAYENEPLTFSVGNIYRGADAEPSDSGICKTLRADMGDQHPCLVTNILPFDTTQITSPQNGNKPKYGDPCHPLCATAHVPSVVTHQTIAGTLCASAAGMSRPAGMASETDLVVAVRTSNTSSNGCGINKDAAYTLDRTNGQAICTSQGFTMQGFGDYKDLDVASSLKQRDYKDATDLVVDNICKVRRLTPMECERLQGFPDHWTNIEGCSDTGRYKALGNSVAVPCVEFVLSGIASLCH